LLDVFNRVMEVVQKSPELDTVQNSLQAFGKLLRVATPAALQQVLPPSTQLFQSVFSGTLPGLGGRPVADASSGFAPDFLDSFAAFTSALIRPRSDFADLVAVAILPLAERVSCQAFVLDVFVEAIDADSISAPVVQSFLDTLPRLIVLAGDSTRQGIAFLLSVLVRRDPAFVESIAPVIPVLLQWWTGSAAAPLLRANLAALFLHLLVIQRESIPPDVVLGVIDTFPPMDREEAAFMANSLLVLLSREGWAREMLSRTAVAVARLLTETKGALRKMKISDETLTELVALFRLLCQDETIAREVFRSVEGRAEKTEVVTAILHPVGFV
jgi:hypothetical protein